jgi:molecular chaperone HtpG
MISYKSLLYIPQKKNPFKNTDDPSQDYGPRLYVQNVLILEQSKALLPAWLRFVQGIIATNDLPLNISREMLQSHPNLEKIQTGITKKILDKLASVRQENPESYKTFLQDFSRYLKEGIYYDTLHRETLASLLLFETVRHPEGISLDTYQESRKISGHSNVIRYVLAKNRNEALAHPYLEAIQAAGEDVVLLTDPIDEWIISVLHQYKESPLESIAAQQKDAAPSEVTESDKDFFAKIQGFLTDKLSAVVYSDRLGSHFAALAS